MLLLLLLSAHCSFSGSRAAPAVPDPRHISNGWNIPSEGYADQPYIVKSDDGAWVCAITTGAGKEGDHRQFGWSRFSPTLRAPNGGAKLKIGPVVRALRLYNRALSTSDAVGSFQAGLAR